MNFLVDAQLPIALCRWLECKGHSAMHVADIGLIGANDETIATRAIADASIIISKDEDFLFLRQPDRFGFIWLRCGNASNRALTAWLDQRWHVVETMLANGERLIEVR